jgi:hypothetical protein
MDKRTIGVAALAVLALAALGAVGFLVGSRASRNLEIPASPAGAAPALAPAVTPAASAASAAVSHAEQALIDHLAALDRLKDERLHKRDVTAHAVDRFLTLARLSQMRGQAGDQLGAEKFMTEAAASCRKVKEQNCSVDAIQKALIKADGRGDTSEITIRR